MSFLINGGIPEGDLPVKVPSGAANIRYVENGKSYSSAMPDVVAASALVQDAIDGVVSDAESQIGEVVRDAQTEINAIISGLGYLPPVEFGSGVLVDSGRVTVEYNGDVYAPVLSEVPFTTTGIFNPGQWRVIQGVVASDLASGGGADMVGYQLDAPGSVQRPLSGKLAERVSVLDFPGVDPTGASLSTEGLQAAINFAALNNARLYIPSGDYRSLSLTIPSPIHISGDGVNETILRYAGSGYTFIQTSESVNMSYMRISGMKILGAGAGVDDGALAFDIKDNGGINRGIVFDSVWFEGFNLGGLRVADAIQFKAIDCRFRSTGRRTAGVGPNDKGAGLFLVAGSAMASTATAAVQCEIIRCSFSACKRGVYVQDDQNLFFPTFQDCDMQSCTYGIYAPGATRARLIGCYFEYNDTLGADIGDGFDIGCRQIGETNLIVYGSKGISLNDSGLVVKSGGATPLEVNTTVHKVKPMLLRSGTLHYNPTTSSVGAAPGFYSGNGSPVGVVSAAIGSFYQDIAGSAGAGSFWVKYGGSSDTDAQWAPCLIALNGTTGARPATPTHNAFYFNTSTGKPNFWSGTKWVHADGSDA